MNLFVDAWLWLIDPANWQGAGSIPVRVGEHLFYTVLAVLFAALIAVPLGWLIGHTGRGRELAVGISGAARALPTFGLLFLFVMLVGVTLRGPSTVLVLVLLAIPPILAGAYAGLEVIDRRTIDAARAMVDMISSLRSYEAIQRAVHAIDDTLGKGINGSGG